MSEAEKKKQPETEEKQTEETETEAVSAENRDAEESAESLAEKLAADLSEAQEHILRIHAEYENFKRRTQREKEELYSAAAGEVLTRLLPVFDNLERAETCTDFDSLKQGVDMILSSFYASLEACGIREIEALGKEFDPNLHNAVLQEESEEYEENTVSQVLQKGYILGERVLRPAMVKVAK